MNKIESLRLLRYAAGLSAFAFFGLSAMAAPPAGGSLTARAQQLVSQGDRAVMQSALQEIATKVAECQTAAATAYCSDLQQAASLLQSALSAR